MASELTLTVNGAKQVVSAAPESPLIFVLRNELKLSGPRLGCGMAQCGSCSVLLDGEEIRTCITPVSYAVGKQVTTIEGLPAVWAAEKKLSPADAAKTLHPVQQAWIDEQVPQCGYCQSGMMIAAVELLAKNPNPTVAQIKDAFTNKPPSPHLCRCGTYAAIIDAVQRAAKDRHESLKGGNAMTLKAKTSSDSQIMPFATALTRRGKSKWAALYLFRSPFQQEFARRLPKADFASDKPTQPDIAGVVA